MELVSDPPDGQPPTGSGLNHFVIAVESMDAVLARLTGAGVAFEPPSSPDGSERFLTVWVTDPDGNRIELVQWPPGHAEGITAADLPG